MKHVSDFLFKLNSMSSQSPSQHIDIVDLGLTGRTPSLGHLDAPLEFIAAERDRAIRRMTALRGAVVRGFI
jgi:hypothetical protein